jgi:hypothetical protein
MGAVLADVGHHEFPWRCLDRNGIAGTLAVWTFRPGFWNGTKEDFTSMAGIWEPLAFISSKPEPFI